MRHKYNSELMEWLNDRSYLRKRQFKPKNIVVFRSSKWRLRDRLTVLDMIRLVMAYQTGIAMKELADHYGVNVKSVRKLLKSMKRTIRDDVASSH